MFCVISMSEENQDKKPKKLSDLGLLQREEWFKARKEAGDKEYGEDHMERYCLVDIYEEVIDAIIILDKWIDKKLKLYEKEKIPKYNYEKANTYHRIIRDELWNCLEMIQLADEYETNRDRIDKKAEDRIWFEGKDSLIPCEEKFERIMGKPGIKDVSEVLDMST